MSYKKPTLFEIYVRLSFADGVLPHAKLFNVVPLLKDSGLTEIEISQALHSAPTMTEPPLTSRVRCWDKERLRLVQLESDLIIVNQTKEYLGWSTFMQLVTKTLQTLKDASIELRYKSAQLHTLDRLTVPRGDYKLGEWLNCDGSILPQWYKESTQACDLTLGLGLLAVDKKNRQLHVHVRPGEKSVEIRFDAVFEEAMSDPASLDRVLNVLHDESNELFETIITNRVRNEIMEGEVN